MTVLVPTLRSNWSVLLASTRARFITITRYPGQLVMDIVFPIVFAAMPILLGHATGGENAGELFEAQTGTANYVAYMMIGSSVFAIVSNAFWHVAYWLRREMEQGTLETLYLAPVERIWIVGGTALYSLLRGVISGILAYLIGSWILGVDPFQGELLLAFAFVVVGSIPLYGVTLIFGAVVLKLKEANSLINLMQWVVSFLMGVFFPITIFPPALRALAMLFPPTWMTNGARSAILGIGYFFGEWYFDLAVLWVFMFIAPAVGYWVFRSTEISIRKNEGVGQF